MTAIETQMLPWHAAPWRLFNAMLDQQRVHHALLLAGPAGLGKARFAERAARALLCEAQRPAEQRPCGECRSCALSEAGSHPDRVDLAPEEDRQVIAVGQVRERIAELVLTPHYARVRVAVVAPADALNRHAADTLLKTLEEPAASVVFLLVTARLAALPVTVRSRCLAIRFRPASSEQASRWLGAGAPPARRDSLLAWHAGAPLAARDGLESGEDRAIEALADDISSLLRGEASVVAAAERWREHGLARAAHWQLKIVTGLMRRAVGATDYGAALATQRIAQKLDLASLSEICETLLDLRSACERQINPNEQLGLEHLAAAWAGLARQD